MLPQSGARPFGLGVVGLLEADHESAIFVAGHPRVVVYGLLPAPGTA